MATADFHAFVIGGNQGTGDADVFFIAEQTVGVVHFKCHAEHSGHGREGDPTFFPGNADAQHIVVLFAGGRVGVAAFAHHAEIGNAACIRAGMRAGERETGNFQTFGQARQIIIFLRFGAVVLQQFARAQ